MTLQPLTTRKRPSVAQSHYLLASVDTCRVETTLCATAAHADADDSPWRNELIAWHVVPQRDQDISTRPISVFIVASQWIHAERAAGGTFVRLPYTDRRVALNCPPPFFNLPDPWIPFENYLPRGNKSAMHGLQSSLKMLLRTSWNLLQLAKAS